MNPCPDSPWPYPRWIAHRGAGRLAPENTLAAMRLGAAHGYRMFECDVKLSADGTPFLLHDSTLERTTNGHGLAGLQDWQDLSQLDAGSWHSRIYAGEPAPTLHAVAHFCLRNGFGLNIEIKPSPGLARRTGEVVATTAARLWQGQSLPPLLTSFDPEALQGAQHSAPELPRGLLLDRWHMGWLETALTLDCCAVVAEQSLWDASSMTQIRSAGLRGLSYTVNDEWAAERLLALGLDGLITDRVDLFSPADG